MQEGFGYQLDMWLLQSASIEEKFGDTQANVKKRLGKRKGMQSHMLIVAADTLVTPQNQGIIIFTSNFLL